VINADDSTTSSLDVLLSMTFPSSNPQYMRFSNDGSERSGWQSYQTPTSWTLLSGDGLKTVYAQFDMDGDYSGDIETSDTITYTQPLPPVSGSTNGEMQFTILTGDTYCIYGNTLDL